MKSKLGINSLRISPVECKRLLDEIERSRLSPAKQKRNNKRYSFRQNNVPIAVEAYGGELSKFLVSTRNISKGGLSFIHGGFLYPGNACHLVLTTLDNQKVPIVGEIVVCRYVSGRVHEVSIRFKHDIDPGLFCEAAAGERKISEPTPTPPTESDESAAA